MIDAKLIVDRIKAVEEAALDLERLSKARSSSENKNDITKSLAAQNAIQNAARKLSVIARNERMGSVALSAKTLFGSVVSRHSVLGSTRAISSSFNYYQTSGADIRGGQRFMDRFAKRFVSTNETSRVIYPTPSGSAGDVAEGDNKPTRQYSFSPVDYQFSKLAVTDTITQEIIIADAGERASRFIIDALIEHVKDELNARLISYLATNGTAFNPALFSGYLNISPGAARWHDLVAAAQLQFERTFADHFLDIKYGDILLAPVRVYWGILQDRKGTGSELYYEPDFLGNLSLSSIWKDYTGTTLVLTHTEAVTIEIVDDIQVYYNRVADANADTNISRVTVEVYYRFVPSKNPVPAIVSTDPLTDLNALQS